MKSEIMEQNGPYVTYDINGFMFLVHYLKGS